jgi:hypothetical protein
VLATPAARARATGQQAQPTVPLPRGEATHDRGRVVGRAIIEDADLLGREALVEEATQARGDVRRLVPRRYQDGDARSARDGTTGDGAGGEHEVLRGVDAAQPDRAARDAEGRRECGGQRPFFHRWRVAVATRWAPTYAHSCRPRSRAGSVLRQPEALPH